MWLLWVLKPNVSISHLTLSRSKRSLAPLHAAAASGSVECVRTRLSCYPTLNPSPSCFPLNRSIFLNISSPIPTAPQSLVSRRYKR